MLAPKINDQKITLAIFKFCQTLTHIKEVTGLDTGLPQGVAEDTCYIGIIANATDLPVPCHSPVTPIAPRLKASIAPGFALSPLSNSPHEGQANRRLVPR